MCADSFVYILQTSACADPCVDTQDTCVSRIGQVVQEMLVRACHGLIWGLRTAGRYGWALLRGTSLSISKPTNIPPFPESFLLFVMIGSQRTSHMDLMNILYFYK